MTTAYIGIGSNIDRHKHIEAAIKELRAIGSDIRVSTIYECEAIGFDSHAFYNLVVEMKTALNLADFARQLRDIELKWGRAVDASKFEPRTIDLDIVLFGQHISCSQPELPRRDIYKYEFVLQPLMDLCPELVVPNDGRTIAQIWQQSSFESSLVPIPCWFN
ncbi:2-amino-4-hydroxy-6-hydroxymethyldihydropteridine diphosphokinase [Vibrio atypicus]|uniref:2-amino-4-hydroxy-6- hydroxymethyldihydropteridine diphosphokinase n=1 Tax=Vibrio atypicus TaxID=558271 RepID=UPI003734F454